MGTGDLGAAHNDADRAAGALRPLDLGIATTDSPTTGRRTSPTAERVLRLAGVTLIVIAALVPIADAAAAALQDSPTIAGLRVSRWLFAVLLLVITAASILESKPRYRNAARTAVFGVAMVMFCTPLLLVAALETLTAVLSPDMLPPVIQELPPRGEPQIGVWLLMAGAGLVMLSASGSAGGAVTRLGVLGRGLATRRSESIALLLGAVGLTLFVLGRYENWMRIDSNVGDWNVVAQSAPLMGLASLVVLVLCAMCVVATAFRPSAPLGVATLTIGWLATLVPATMLVIGRATPSLTAPEWLRSRLADWSSQGTELASGLPDAVPVDVPELPRTLEVQLMIGLGTTMLFAAGLFVGLCGVFVVRASCSRSAR